MNRKYSHIFFDLDNTLWDFEKNSKKAMEETFAFFKLDKNTEFDLFFEIYSKHNTELWENYRNNGIGKKELTKKRFENTFTELEICGIDPVVMNGHYLKVMPKQKQLNDGVMETLRYLKEKKYLLFIITNGFRDVQHEKLISSGLNSFFSKMFISEEVKTPKPGLKIFEYAVKSSNAKKAKSIMIGDDWKVDVLGALNFGMDAVYFQKNPELDFQELSFNDVNTGQFYKIGSIQQLKNIF